MQSKSDLRSSKAWSKWLIFGIALVLIGCCPFGGLILVRFLNGASDGLQFAKARHVYMAARRFESAHGGRLLDTRVDVSAELKPFMVSSDGVDEPREFVWNRTVALLQRSDFARPNSVWFFVSTNPNRQGSHVVVWLDGHISQMNANDATKATGLEILPGRSHFGR